MDTTTVENQPKPANPPAPRMAPPPAKPERPKRSPRSNVLAVIVIGLIVLVAAGTWYWLHTAGRVSTDDAQVDGHIAPISSRIPGSVLEVLVDNGIMVKAGQVLVRIDPRDYQARVDQAKAALVVAEGNARAAQAGVPLARGTTTTGVAQAQSQVAAAEAELEGAQTSFTQASTSEIEVARAKVASAEATYTRAHADVERMRPLAAKAEISQLQFDAYVAAERVAAADLKQRQDELRSAEQGATTQQQAVKSAQARVAAARVAVAQARANEEQVKVSSAQAQAVSASIEQARANLAMAELDLSYTNIVAPVDGEVTKKTVEVGQSVQAGQALMAVVPLRDVWVTANFKETQLAGVRAGQSAEVKVDMYGRTIAGRVDSIAGATGAKLSLLPPENATGNFVKVVQRIPVKIVFDRLPEGVVLRPGMNVDATIITK